MSTDLTPSAAPSGGQLTTYKKLWVRPVESDLPAHLTSPESQDVNKVLDQFVRPPRLKVIQGTAKPPYNEYNAGTVLITPQNEILAEKGKKFDVVPLFTYVEYLHTNPLGIDPFIIGRSTDIRSDIAKRALNPEKRTAPCEKDPKKFTRYQANMIFICAIVNAPEFVGMQAAMVFSKSEYKTGERWSGKLRGKDKPMCGTVWNVSTSGRSNDKGAWVGYDIERPELRADQFVFDPEEYSIFYEQHCTYKKLFMGDLIQVEADRDDDDPQLSESQEF